MKKTLLFLIGTILLFSFGDRSQNSFSQRSPRRVVLKYIPTAAQIRSEKFKKDTTEASRLISAAVDSLQEENMKTEARLEIRKETITIQKKNQYDLKEISGLLKKSIAETKKEERKLPEVIVIYGSKKPAPIPVNIELQKPDSLPLPPIKKTFLQKLRFWK